VDDVQDLLAYIREVQAETPLPTLLKYAGTVAASAEIDWFEAELKARKPKPKVEPVT
jgi:hypothetical protein